MTASGTSRIARIAFLLALVTGWGVLFSPRPQCAEAITQEFLGFNFFWHDNLHAPVDPSSFVIVNGLDPPPFPGGGKNFGTVVVFDDSMTLTPDPASVEIGRGRGSYIFDLNYGDGIEFLWTAEFNEASGYGAGSTLTFKGFDRIADPVREIAIVGGTGFFRLARGWLDLTTYSDIGGGVAVVNVTANVYYGFG